MVFRFFPFTHLNNIKNFKVLFYFRFASFIIIISQRKNLIINLITNKVFYPSIHQCLIENQLISLKNEKIRLLSYTTMNF